jgi:hypothetical protein
MDSSEEQSPAVSTPITLETNDNSISSGSAEPSNVSTNVASIVTSNVTSNVKPCGQPLVDFLQQLEDYSPTVRHFEMN